MATKTAQKRQTIYDKPWKHLIAAGISWVLAALAASWAVDSAKMLAYALAIFFTLWGFHHLYQAARQIPWKKK